MIKICLLAGLLLGFIICAKLLAQGGTVSIGWNCDQEYAPDPGCWGAIQNCAVNSCPPPAGLRSSSWYINSEIAQVVTNLDANEPYEKFGSANVDCSRTCNCTSKTSNDTACSSLNLCTAVGWGCVYVTNCTPFVIKVRQDNIELCYH